MRTLTIIIDDDNTECSQYYITQYKLTTETEYTTFSPNALSSPIIVTGLEDDTNYNVRVTRVCCDGTTSAFTQIDVNTTPNSPF